jgi:hypothetical protein
MEELMYSSLPPLFIQPTFLQLGYREISEEDVSTSRGLSADGF